MAKFRLFMLWMSFRLLTTTIAIDCGCPLDCNEDALGEHNGAPWRCNERIGYMMQHWHLEEQEACAAASKAPTESDEHNSISPCRFEACHPDHSCGDDSDIDEVFENREKANAVKDMMTSTTERRSITLGIIIGLLVLLGAVAFGCCSSKGFHLQRQSKPFRDDTNEGNDGDELVFDINDEYSDNQNLRKSSEDDDHADMPEVELPATSREII